VFTWFARWLRSRQTTNRKNGINNRTPMSRTRYIIYLICIIFFVFITILTVLYHLTRGENDENLTGNDDPQFNPLNNPFIRVAGKFLKNPLKNSDQPK
jgi:ABC-type Fe3+ transport system permease subunit